VRFIWSGDALDTLPPGVEPYQVMWALVGPRLRDWLTSEVLALHACHREMYVVVFVAETDDADEWEIEGVRRMLPPEIARYRKLVGGIDE